MADYDDEVWSLDKPNCWVLLQYEGGDITIRGAFSSEDVMKMAIDEILGEVAPFKDKGVDSGAVCPIPVVLDTLIGKGGGPGCLEPIAKGVPPECLKPEED